ncbi:unnamed protein product [Auanema sp. JU1783]|nr:unnamed protein product [Auanema sp. JU1783]
MDRERIQNIVQTVCLINNPSTSNEERIAATKAIESLKEGNPEVLAEVGFELVGLRDDLLSHVGWNFVEELLRYKWNSIPVEFRVCLRNKILNYLELGPIQQTIESTARSVVAMMEHEWPQNWPELFPQLEKMSSMSYLHCCTSFAIFRRLVENVVTLATVASSQRRKEMHNVIIYCLPDILRISLERIEACQNVPINSEVALIIKYVISFLAEVCEWAPSTSLDPVVDKLVKLVVVHLNTPDLNIYEIAARCLAALSIRKKEKTESVVAAFFQSEVISAILTTTSRAAEVAHSSESHYLYLKALCDLLSSIGNNLAKVWSEKSPPPNFEVYLSAINAFFHHPSLYLKLEAIEVFVIISQCSLGEHSQFCNVMTNVLDHLPESMLKHGYPSEKQESTARHYSQMDFDDDSEWTTSFIKLRERIRLLMRQSMPRHLPQLLQIFNAWVFQRIVTDAVSIPTDDWEPMQKFSKTVIQTALENNYISNNETKHRLETFANSLLDIISQMTNWDVASEVLSIYSAFLPLYEGNWDGLFKYVTVLKHCLCSSKCHKVLNRHCISQILKVVSLFPTFLKNNVDKMVTLCSDVQSSISEMQMAQLIQVLAALSNLVDDPAHKRELLSYAVASVAEYIISTVNKLNTLDDFIAFNGFNIAPSEDDPDSSTREDVERRKMLRCNLFALEGVLMQVEKDSPMKDVMKSLYAPLFKLSKFVLEINATSSIARMHSSYKDIMKMTAAEKQQIYALMNEGSETQVGKSLPESRDVVDINRQYITCLSENCVNILSYCTTKFADTLYSDPHFEQYLNSTAAELPKLDIYRLRIWIKKGWRNIIFNCPQDKRHCLTTLLTTMSEHLQSYLTQLWNQIASIDYESSEVTQEELFNEHLACVITREYVFLLRLFYLGQETSPTVDDRGSIRIGPLGHWLLDNKVALASMLYTSFSILTWRDTISAIRIIPLCRVFVDRLSASYDDQVAVAMLFSSIQSLQIHGPDEVAGPSLLGLIFHIYITLRKFSNSFPGVLQQVPEASPQDVELFDKKIQRLITGEESMQEKQRREMLKKLLRGVISLTTSELHKRPVFLRPLPKLEKKSKPEYVPDYFDVAEIFST